jgi:hypothetical protein
MFAPFVSGVAVAAGAVELALVGAIVPEAVEITVVANGCTEDSPAVGRTVFTVPVVTALDVAESVGVIVEEASVSAKMPAIPLDVVAVVALETVVDAVPDGV